MSLEQIYNLICPEEAEKEPTEQELRIMKQYFNIDYVDPWTKYKRAYPNMYPCVINRLVMDEQLSKCKNRAERRQLLKEIKKQNKNNKKK